MEEDRKRRPPRLWRGAVLVLTTVTLGTGFLTAYFIIPRVVGGPLDRHVRLGRFLDEMADNFRSSWWLYAIGAAVLAGLAVSGKIDPVVRFFAVGMGLAALAAVAIAVGIHFLPAFLPR